MWRVLVGCRPWVIFFHFGESIERRLEHAHLFFLFFILQQKLANSFLYVRLCPVETLRKIVCPFDKEILTYGRVWYLMFVGVKSVLLSKKRNIVLVPTWVWGRNKLKSSLNFCIIHGFPLFGSWCTDTHRTIITKKKKRQFDLNLEKLMKKSESWILKYGFNDRYKYDRAI